MQPTQRTALLNSRIRPLSEITVTTKRKRTKATAREGINFVRSIVERHNCIFQEIDLDNDIGNDAYIEFVQEEDATGCCIAVQIKSGISYAIPTQDRYAFSTDRNHFEYWHSHTLPIGAIIFDPETRRAAWCDITEGLQRAPHLIETGPYTISIPATAEFSESTFEGFRTHFLCYRRQYTQVANLGRALEQFADYEDVASCADGMRALFSFHRNRSASWYYLMNCFHNFRPILCFSSSGNGT